MPIAWCKPVATLAATLAAATVPTATLAALVFVELPREMFGEFLFVVLVLFLFALGHVLLLGLPVAGWLLRVERLRVLPMTVAGAIVGALPYGVFALVDPLHGAFSFDDWMEWLQEIALFASFGVAGALTFLVVYRSIARRDAVAGA